MLRLAPSPCRGWDDRRLVRGVNVEAVVVARTVIEAVAEVTAKSVAASAAVVRGTVVDEPVLVVAVEVVVVVVVVVVEIVVVVEGVGEATVARSTAAAGSVTAAAAAGSVARSTAAAGSVARSTAEGSVTVSVTATAAAAGTVAVAMAATAGTVAVTAGTVVVAGGVSVVTAAAATTAAATLRETRGNVRTRHATRARRVLPGLAEARNPGVASSGHDVVHMRGATLQKKPLIAHTIVEKKAINGMSLIAHTIIKINSHLWPGIWNLSVVFDVLSGASRFWRPAKVAHQQTRGLKRNRSATPAQSVAEFDVNAASWRVHITLVPRKLGWLVSWMADTFGIGAEDS